MNLRLFRKIALSPLLALALPAAAALDVKDIALGASERDIKRKLPSAHCKALEWQSKAADRRCDDSRLAFGGVEVQATFYLKKDVLEAFDLRFDTRELDRFVAFLKSRYGAPQSESKDSYEGRGRGRDPDPRRAGQQRDEGPSKGKDNSTRQVYRVLWESGKDRAVLIAQLEKRRASMLVSRGDFDEEIYRVR